MEVRLTIVGGKANRKVVTVQLPAVIGRSREADLTIAHPMVSRRHCELFEVQGLLRIRDLGSLNGTLVAGKEITEAPLRPNDEFSIGPLTFRVEYEYGGDVTVVAPIVPEERPDEAPAQPVAPPVPPDLPSLFQPAVENPPQAHAPSGEDVAAEAAAPGAAQTGAGEAEGVPPAELPPEPAPAYPAPLPQKEPVAGPEIPSPGVGEEPAGPPPLFGDLPPTIGPSSAPEGSESLWGTEDSAIASPGTQTIAPLDFLSKESDRADEFALAETPSGYAPFSDVNIQAQEESLSKVGQNEAASGGADTPEPASPDEVTEMAGPAKAAPPIFESAGAEQSEGFEMPWVETAPQSGSASEDQAGTQAPPAVPAPSPARAEGLRPSQEKKSGWRWWPFGKRKREPPGDVGGPRGEPSSGRQPAESPAPAGGLGASTSAPAERARAAPTPSSSPPPVPKASPQGEAEMDPELEAFLRDLQ